MKRYLLFASLILALILTASLVGQGIKHAPAVAQCQADQRLWLSKTEEGDSPRLPKYDVLSEWDSEMTDCEKVDPNNKWTYYNTSEEITEIRHTRLIDFVSRHNLWQEFIAEDGAGKR